MRDLFRYLADVLRFASFLAFVFLGFSIVRARVPETRRRRIHALVVYAIALHVAIGIAQRDDWPFSPYPLMRGVWNGAWVYQKLTPMGVDAAGREWDIDPRSWAPVFPLVMQEWFNVIYPSLDARQRREAVSFLLGRAETARRAIAAGSRFGNDRFLGPLTAPDWWLYRRVDRVSPAPYVAIRFYRDSWRPIDKLNDPARFQRQMIAAYDANR